MKEFPSIIVGAGPAGLATSFCMKERGINHLVLEQGSSVGHTWAHLYDSLRLHTGKHLSSLPGKPFSSSIPLFPTRLHFLNYLQEYVAEFSLPVQLGSKVTQVGRDDGKWLIRTSDEVFVAKNLIVSTGIVSNPYLPSYNGQKKFHGRVIHSVEYRNSQPYLGKRVLVVGVGNSGAEIASELATNEVTVTIAVRNGANVMPLKLMGIPIQYYSVAIEKLPISIRRILVLTTGALTRLVRPNLGLPRPPYSVLDRPPVIGFHLVDAIRAGKVLVKSDIREIYEDGVRFHDGTAGKFDHIILATGYRAAVEFLKPLIKLDDRGFGRRNRIVSLDQPNLYFVGHNYSTVGALTNIARDSKAVAKIIAKGDE